MHYPCERLRCTDNISACKHVTTEVWHLQFRYQVPYLQHTHQFLQPNTMTVPKIRPRPLPSTSFPIHSPCNNPTFRKYIYMKYWRHH
jgi:hypothetical protein